eukprot:SAG31_NODE_17894_length_654_cov_1.127928_1_plen_168_part_01
MVMLVNAVNYMVISSKKRTAQWRQWRERVQFRILSSNEYMAGCTHKWFKWDENMITGKKTGGSMFGVVMFEIDAQAQGECLVRVTPAAASVIEQHCMPKHCSERQQLRGGAKGKPQNIDITLGRTPQEKPCNLGAVVYKSECECIRVGGRTTVPQLPNRVSLTLLTDP